MPAPGYTTILQEGEPCRSKQHRYDHQKYKTCPFCKRPKLLGYSKNWIAKNREQAAALWRSANLRKRYGITPEEYNAMVESRNNRCDICGNPPKARLVVDHNHTTGKVRGLLCTGCNTRAGFLEHGLMEKTLAYLGRTSD